MLLSGNGRSEEGSRKRRRLGYGRAGRIAFTNYVCNLFSLYSENLGIFGPMKMSLLTKIRGGKILVVSYGTGFLV